MVIGIPNWNGKNVIDECLDSIYELTDYETFSVTVVDNGSTDGSVEMIENHYNEVKLIKNNSNRGVPRAFNQIIESARTNDADFIILMNSDIEVQNPDWMSNLIEIATKGDLGIVGCKNITKDGEVEHIGDNVPLSPHTLSHPIFPINLREKYNYNRYNDESKFETIEYTDLVQGSVMVVDLEMIENIGDFDLKYSPAYFADYDYCIRAAMEGYRVAYTPDVTVVHGEQETGLGATERLYYFKRNELRFILTYYPITWMLFTLPGFVLPPLGLERFFIEFENGNMELNQSFVQFPLKVVGFLLNIFIYNVKSMLGIIKKRNDNSDIRGVLK